VVEILSSGYQGYFFAFISFLTCLLSSPRFKKVVRTLMMLDLLHGCGILYVLLFGKDKGTVFITGSSTFCKIYPWFYVVERSAVRLYLHKVN
jgi:hypothetical protein